MIFKTDVAKHLEYGGRAQFLEGSRAWPSKRSTIAAEVSSSGDKETYVGLGEHPMPVEALDQVKVRGLSERSIEITNKDWEVTLAVSHNTINDDRVGNVLPWMRSAGLRFEEHMDKLAFLALNGGDGTTYGSCYDGYELFDTLHADAKAEYTTAQSNLGTSTLTLDTFNSIWVLAKALMDSRGEVVDMPFDLLTVSPSLKTVAAQICDNVQAYDTANREINPFSGEFRYQVSPHFDSAAWVISCSVLPEKPVILQMRQRPELVIWDDESVAAQGGIRYFKWSARYQVGYGDWRTAYMGKT